MDNATTDEHYKMAVAERLEEIIKTQDDIVREFGRVTRLLERMVEKVNLQTANQKEMAVVLGKVVIALAAISHQHRSR